MSAGLADRVARRATNWLDPARRSRSTATNATAPITMAPMAPAIGSADGEALATDSRRSFLTKTTMVATALAVVPADFILRPQSAYASVCNCQGQRCPCGSLCCDGYTEFCCTLTGQNGCPPGTIAAGWWKVDGSQFCGGAPRYYLDCNAQCGSCGCSGGVCSGACSGTPCGCAWGNCDNRKAGCVRFRYGQCHQEIACLGPIVCRIVTCTPPWVLDGSCTTASRTDNRTAPHYRPCLDAPFGGFDGITDTGAAIATSGWAIDQNNRDGIEVRLFLDGQVVTSTMADLDRPDVAAAYPYYGGRRGFAATLPVAPGRHNLCVYAVDQGSGVGTFLAFREFDVAGVRGTLDVTEGGIGVFRVAGWAVEPAEPQGAATIRVLLNGTEVAVGTTGTPRPDVAAAVGGVGPNAGFDLTIAAAPGTYDVCVDIVYRNGVAAGRLGCTQVVVT